MDPNDAPRNYTQYVVKFSLILTFDKVMNNTPISVSLEPLYRKI
jgi:hypothetical protein